MVCRGAEAPEDEATAKGRVTISPTGRRLTPDFALFPVAIGFPHSVITWASPKTAKSAVTGKQLPGPTRGGTGVTSATGRMPAPVDDGWADGKSDCAPACFRRFDSNRRDWCIMATQETQVTNPASIPFRLVPNNACRKPRPDARRASQKPFTTPERLLRNGGRLDLPP